MRWIDTVLYKAIVTEMERHDRREGHSIDVMPRGGLVGTLTVLALGVLLLRGLPPLNTLDSIAWYLPWIPIVPTVLLVLWARLAAKPAIQRRQFQINEEISSRASAPGTFVFYLRPFNEDGSRPVPTRAASGAIAVLFGFQIDFELMLSQALRWTFPVVALGLSERSKGAGRKLVTDAEWQTAFADLGAKCATIVCIPGISPSSLWELRQIRSDPALLRKTLFFMPPRMSFRLQRFIPEAVARRTERHWGEIRDKCNELGLFLPGYKPAGCAFFVDEDGRAGPMLDLWGFDAQRVETLCFAAAIRPHLAAEDFRNGIAALAARRPLAQRFAARMFTRNAIPFAIWTPIVVGGAALTIDLLVLLATRYLP